MKNSSGQVSIEMALMLILMVAVMTSVSSTFKENNIFASLVSGPWTHLSGLIQNGTWGTPEKTMIYHPNREARVSSVPGDLVE